MICEYCGKKIPNDSSVCPFCRYQLKEKSGYFFERQNGFDEWEDNGAPKTVLKDFPGGDSTPPAQPRVGSPAPPASGASRMTNFQSSPERPAMPRKTSSSVRPAQKKKNKNKNVLIAIVAVLALIVLLVSGKGLYGKLHPKTEEADLNAVVSSLPKGMVMKSATVIFADDEDPSLSTQCLIETKTGTAYMVGSHLLGRLTGATEDQIVYDFENNQIEVKQADGSSKLVKLGKNKLQKIDGSSGTLVFVPVREITTYYHKKLLDVQQDDKTATFTISDPRIQPEKEEGEGEDGKEGKGKGGKKQPNNVVNPPDEPLQQTEQYGQQGGQGTTEQPEQDGQEKQELMEPPQPTLAPSPEPVDVIDSVVNADWG